MSLESTLADIATKLKEGRYRSEAAISTGIVLRVLRALNWQDHDTEVVWPEYTTMNGRVDFALCDPPSKPKVFVEVKRHGMAQGKDAVRQALHYAFDEGVNFVVLTDGQTWSFYLPTERGSYEDRRVLKLDLCESPLHTSSDALARFLEYGRVASGEALESARKEHRDRTSRDTVLRTLPEAWSELVRKGDESLVRLLADAVESRARVRPGDADVLDFLGSLKMSRGPHVPSLPSKPTESQEPHHRAVIVGPPNSKASNRSKTSQEPYQRAVIVGGKRHDFKSPVTTMVAVLTELQEADRRFLEQLAIHPGIKRQTRMVVAMDAADIYPKSPHLRHKVAQLPDGWLVCTNFHAEEVIQVINIAAEVSGISVEWYLPTESTGRNKQPTTATRAISSNGTVIVEGQRHEYKSLLGAIEFVLNRLQEADNHFLSELSEHPKIRNRQRALVARSVEEIYPNSPHLRRRVRHLPDGWLLCTNAFDSEKALRFVDALENMGGVDLVWDPPITSD